MSNNERKSTSLNLTDDFDGVTLARTENGLIVDVSSLSGVDVTVILGGDNRIVKQTPVCGSEIVFNTFLDKQAYCIGDVLPDGWIVGPVSPTTGKPISIQPSAELLEGCQTWYDGENFVKQLCSQGYAGARQPDEGELTAIFTQIMDKQRNLHAKFSLSDDRWIWTSSPVEGCPDQAVAMQYDLYEGGGNVRFPHKENPYGHVRIVRDQEDIMIIDSEKSQVLYCPEP